MRSFSSLYSAVLMLVGLPVLLIGADRAMFGPTDIPKAKDEKKAVVLSSFIPHSLCFSADGKFLYLGGAGGPSLPPEPGARDGDEYYDLAPQWEIQVWDWAAKKRTESRRGTHPTQKLGKAAVQRLVCSPDGKFLLGSLALANSRTDPYTSGLAKVLWSVGNWKARPFPNGIDFLPCQDGGPCRVLVESDGAVVLGELKGDGEIAITNQTGLSCSSLSNRVLSPNGKQIAFVCDSGVKVRNVVLDEKGRHYGRFYRDGHTRVVGCAAFSPDMSLLATGAGKCSPELGGDDEYFWDEPEDHTVKLRDLKTGKIVASLGFHKSYISQVLFSHDGKRIVTLSDYTIRIWETKSARLLFEVENCFCTKPSGPNGFLVANPKSNVVAAIAGADGVLNQKVYIWDIGTGKSLGVLEE